MARIIHSIPASEDSRVAAAQVVEFMGGLGDVLIRCHHSKWYEALAALPQGKEAYAIIISHNPHSKELFLWMPTADRITIVDVGYHHPWDDPSWRGSLNLPPSPSFECRIDDPISYYPSETDLPWLTLARTLGRYVVTADSAGDPERTIPSDISARIVELSSRRGIPVVRVGRDYTHSFNQLPVQKSCIAPRAPEGCIDMSGQLSVPGVGSLVAGALGVVCSHSAVCHMAQYGKRPFFLMYPQRVFDEYVWRGPVGYMKGIDLPQNDHLTFASWTPDRYLKWLDVIQG